jgi:hypothetical protein
MVGCQLVAKQTILGPAESIVTGDVPALVATA